MEAWYSGSTGSWLCRRWSGASAGDVGCWERALESVPCPVPLSDCSGVSSFPYHVLTALLIILCHEPGNLVARNPCTKTSEDTSQNVFSPLNSLSRWHSDENLIYVLSISIVKDIGSPEYWLKFLFKKMFRFIGSIMLVSLSLLYRKASEWWNTKLRSLINLDLTVNWVWQIMFS